MRLTAKNRPRPTLVMLEAIMFHTLHVYTGSTIVYSVQPYAVTTLGAFSRYFFRRISQLGQLTRKVDKYHFPLFVIHRPIEKEQLV